MSACRRGAVNLSCKASARRRRRISRRLNDRTIVAVASLDLCCRSFRTFATLIQQVDRAAGRASRPNVATPAASRSMPGSAPPDRSECLVAKRTSRSRTCERQRVPSVAERPDNSARTTDTYSRVSGSGLPISAKCHCDIVIRSPVPSLTVPGMHHGAAVESCVVSPSIPQLVFVGVGAPSLLSASGRLAITGNCPVKPARSSRSR